MLRIASRQSACSLRRKRTSLRFSTKVAARSSSLMRATGTRRTIPGRATVGSETGSLLWRRISDHCSGSLRTRWEMLHRVSPGLTVTSWNFTVSAVRPAAGKAPSRMTASSAAVAVFMVRCG